MERPSKDPDILEKARRLIAEGNYRDTWHSNERKTLRVISRFEIIHVIQSGYWEKKKDKFDDEWSAWNYAIRGKTLDKRELRVIVSIDEKTGLLIITVIDLTK